MNIYKLVIKVLLPKKCVPEKMSEQELYKIIRKRHCRNIALLKLYTFNKVYSFLLIVKWFYKKRAWSSYDFSFFISKFITL